VKIYVVGGAVRDRLLGLPVKDLDYVVVGSTPEEMIQKGFRPVGQDFPVFLHPITNNEYALARTERKTAPGYKGFVFHADAEVTLPQDLARRDLTINAMAQEIDEHGELVGPVIDPYGGQADLKNKIFRHVGPAFVEDPLRVLRVARFAARFVDFSIAQDTLDLLKNISASGELKALVKERVWQELVKGLNAEKPSKMFAVLVACGADGDLFQKAFDSGYSEKFFKYVDASAAQKMKLPQRYGALLHGLSHDLIEALSNKLSATVECKDYAVLTHQLVDGLSRYKASSSAEILLSILDRVDVWRKPERFLDLIEVVKLVPCETASLQKAYELARAVDVAEIAKSVQPGPGAGDMIKLAIQQARVNAIKAGESPAQGA